MAGRIICVPCQNFSHVKAAIASIYLLRGLIKRNSFFARYRTFQSKFVQRNRAYRNASLYICSVVTDQLVIISFKNIKTKSLTRQENRIVGVEVGGGGVGGAVVQRKHDVDRMLRNVTT